VQPGVSVVIPTWNRARTIRQAIDSALQQSLPVLEVLVCDDGSTDDTESIVAHIAERDARVRWVSGGRGGRPAIPRNRGLRERGGEWVAFLDSDDAWLPGKLSVQIEAARTLGTLAVCSNATRVATGGRELGSLLDWHRPRLKFGDLLAVNRVVCSSCVVHGSLLTKTGGFPEEPEFKAIEDYVLWLRVAALTDFAFCEDALVHYWDDPEGSIRGGQTIEPETQRALVFAATTRWLLNGELGAARRASALASVGLARSRLAFADFARHLKHGTAR
jgi:glycosyltransferase involved in cell wall biosynthesis